MNEYAKRHELNVQQLKVPAKFCHHLGDKLTEDISENLPRLDTMYSKSVTGNCLTLLQCY